MDAATLYTVVTLASGQKHIRREEFPSAAACFEARAKLEGKLIEGRPASHSCHVRIREDASTTLYAIVALPSGKMRVARHKAPTAACERWAKHFRGEHPTALIWCSTIPRQQMADEIGLPEPGSPVLDAMDALGMPGQRRTSIRR